MVITPFPCSTQLSMKFKLTQSMKISGLNHKSHSIILLINIKIPNIVDISTFMSTILHFHCDYLNEPVHLSFEMSFIPS